MKKKEKNRSLITSLSLLWVVKNSARPSKPLYLQRFEWFQCHFVSSPWFCSNQKQPPHNSTTLIKSKWAESISVAILPTRLAFTLSWNAQLSTFHFIHVTRRKFIVTLSIRFAAYSHLLHGETNETRQTSIGICVFLSDFIMTFSIEWENQISPRLRKKWTVFFSFVWSTIYTVVIYPRWKTLFISSKFFNWLLQNIKQSKQIINHKQIGSTIRRTHHREYQ